jgi:carbamoyl-phosphate synthase large subunit
MIGASRDAIDMAEDRELFRDAMAEIGLETPRSIATAWRGAARARRDRLPAIIRPSFTMGGTGGGIAYNREDSIEIVERGSTPRPPTKC